MSSAVTVLGLEIQILSGITALLRSQRRPDPFWSKFNAASGSNSVLDIAERSGLSFDEIRSAINRSSAAACSDQRDGHVTNRRDADCLPSRW
jgi:hypothetical protein